MISLRTLLLIGILSTALESKAVPPRQHSVVGVIEKIDGIAQTLVLVDPVTKERRAFVWDNSTRLRCNSQSSEIGTLQPGMLVRGYYRNWSGRNMLREIRCALRAARK